MAYRASVITSIFKSGEFIQGFLENIVAQDFFSHFEFLLLDADSPDGEYELIKPYLLQHENLKYSKIGKTTVYEAWNKGIQLAQSDLITNWNTDDRRVGYTLDIQSRFLEDNPEVDVCYGLTMETKIPNITQEQIYGCREEDIFPCLRGDKEDMRWVNSPHSMPMWRKSIHDRFGMFDTQYFSGADYEMWLRVLFQGGKLARIPFIAGAYYRNPTGVSTRPETLDLAIKEVHDIRKKYYGSLYNLD